MVEAADWSIDQFGGGASASRASVIITQSWENAGRSSGRWNREHRNSSCPWMWRTSTFSLRKKGETSTSPRANTAAWCHRWWAWPFWACRGGDLWLPRWQPRGSDSVQTAYDPRWKPPTSVHLETHKRSRFNTSVVNKWRTLGWFVDVQGGRTVGPDVWLAAVLAEVKDFRRRPLDRKLSTWWAGVLVI